MQIRQVAAATLMVIVLTGAAACGGSDSSSSSSSSSPPWKQNGSTGPGKPAGDKPSTPEGPRTALKGMDLCKALKAESLTAIGVQPSDIKKRTESSPSSDPSCDWLTGETEVELKAITNWSPDMSEGQKKINVLGFPGTSDVVLGNSCELSMQANDDELEVNVLNEDSSNQALQGSKACDVATDFTRQVLSGVTKK